MMQIRKQTVQHPFGTIKSWTGSTHFQTKMLKRVSTEMNLYVLAYNLKRMVNIIGVGPLTTAMRAYKASFALQNRCPERNMLCTLMNDANSYHILYSPSGVILF
jgi:hypothetical protein